MDIEDLLTFVEVANAGGISPAARRLNVSKSIISRRLARLEADLGVQLLARTTRGAALTEAGSTLGRFKADNATALAAAAIEGLGIAWIPDGVTRPHVDSGALVPVMTRYPPPSAGVYVVRPPGQHPARKVRVLTDMLIACFKDYA